MPNRFDERKRKILEQLAIPDQEYTDLSPKGSVDEGVRELCDKINGLDDYVTTSSCAGRVAVFLEGALKSNTAEDGEPGPMAIQGGKGGGRWLYVSHEPVAACRLQSDGSTYEFFGIGRQDGPSSSEPPSRFVHFKFEPMILHILASSLESAQHVHSAAMSAGFRESGISGITGPAPTPMVAVRTQGLAFDCIVAYEDSRGNIKAMVSEDYMQSLVTIANQRFVVNKDRKERFRRALLNLDSKPVAEYSDGWEPADVRRERKRAEGLRRREELRQGETEMVRRVSDCHEADSPGGLFPVDAPP
ncbi:Hypothetical predicted protein [Lecanosticta acicola]|uniref:tRNA wybutosine-synthesizing protein 3 n=1 Tax=Lecanosticta acicola TaxID=111012 RepID=A0AAI8Z416_9PEZI|nr:Hypothetical predicted protein [Lecanosticta acicola]